MHDPMLAVNRAIIDALDEKIITLLLERTAAVEKVAAAKAAANVDAYMRPGREAEIIRRLLQRPLGSMPPLVIFRLWREIMMASLQIEQAFKVAVYAPKDCDDYWRMARDHFGGVTPLHSFETTGQVLRAISDGTALLGVVPDMGDDKVATPWWRHILGMDSKTPRFVFKLPFVADSSTSNVSAFVVGRVPFEPSGNDHTFIAIEAAATLSRAKLKQLCTDAGIDTESVQVWQDASIPDSRYFLVQFNEYVAEGDPRLAAMQTEAGKALQYYVHLGGYAVPITTCNPKQCNAA